MCIRNYEAAREIDRIATLSAFNVPTATSRKKVNQHATLYSFGDGSRLMVYATRAMADAWHPEWKGHANDVRLGPVKGAALRVNRQGD